MSESIETIEREFAQSQKRSDERRIQTHRQAWRNRVTMFLFIVLILLLLGAVIFSILIISGAIKM